MNNNIKHNLYNSRWNCLSGFWQWSKWRGLGSCNCWLRALSHKHNVQRVQSLQNINFLLSIVMQYTVWDRGVRFVAVTGSRLSSWLCRCPSVSRQERWGRPQLESIIRVSSLWASFDQTFYQVLHHISLNKRNSSKCIKWIHLSDLSV